ncbi:pyridoxamine 5'-phosphate oxidase-domain-containing protein [Schizothecium vesticola]|uniref:Pyridoxamine 5'-phosphate oxidase-domain-containing protein n=1 Tax=Schizothecium vesticola TaxID=314040 RepID=A0AA40F1V9_9PEZI|nr:pyridoxamine 5'-phosphate oxidase-domain-containing protein [Schizothecium vesticola]
MRALAPLLLPLLPFAAALPPPTTNRIPTSYESAVLGRRILALTPLGTISTVFPSDSSDPRRPANIGGAPHNILSYLADCDPSSDSGHPTILALPIETTFHNVAAGSNVSLALSWTPPFAPGKRISSSQRQKVVPAPSEYSAANLPRFSLMGEIEPIAGGDGDAELAACFVRAHPDAKYWLPGNRIHEAHFVRLVVRAVYWVGGFGDRAYIGWIPADEWTGVTREEWEGVRLPGEEKGWGEWSVGEEGDL